MTPSKPLLTALRLGAVVLAVGVGGYLVVGAQERATGGEVAPEGTLAKPTLAPEPADGDGLPAATDPFLFSSKSAAIEVLPESAPGASIEVRPTGEVYLPSSKVLSPDALKAVNGAAPPPPPIEASFLPSSKSLSIDSSRFAPVPQPEAIEGSEVVAPSTSKAEDAPLPRKD